MARNRIKGITVEIGGDTTKLDKALAGTNKELASTQKSLKDVERLLKLDPGNTELLEQKQRLLAQAAEGTAQKLDTLRQAAEGADAALQRGQAYQEKYEPLKAELDQVAASMKGMEANAASMQAKLDAGQISTEQYDAFNQKLEETRKKHKELQQAVKDLDAEFSGARMNQSQYDALQRELAETEREMKELEEQAKDSTDSLQKLGNAAGTVSDKAGRVRDTFAPVTAAIGGVAAAAVAAVPATEEFRADMSMLEQNAKTAGVGLEATKAAFESLNAVSGETDSSIEAVSNLLQTGFTESNLQKAVEGVANAAITFPDTVKIESLADSLQETLATGTATGQFAEVLDRLGYGAENFTNNLALCTTEAQKQELALSALTNGPLQGVYDGWAAANPELVEGRNATLELQYAISDLATAIAPIVTQITQLATQVLNWFNGLDSGAQGMIVSFGLVLGAISPVAGAVSSVSKVISNLSKVDIAGIGTAAKGMASAVSGAMSGAGSAVSSLAATIKTGLGGAFAFLAANPIVAVIAAIAAVVTGLVVLWNTNEGFRNAVISAWEGIKGAFASFDEWLSGVFTTDWTEKLGALGEVLNGLFASISTIWDGIKQVFGGIITFITGVFSGNWKQAWQGIVDVFSGIFSTIAGIITAPINAVIGVINGMLQGLTAAINGVIGLLNNISITIPEWVPLIGGNTLGFNLSELTAPQIPLLANGGVVPPNDPFLAVLGDNKRESEIVAPYSAIKQAAGDAFAELGGTGGAQDVHIYLHKGGGFMREFKFSLDDETRRQGVKLTEV